MGGGEGGKPWNTFMPSLHSRHPTEAGLRFASEWKLSLEL